MFEEEKRKSNLVFFFPDISLYLTIQVISNFVMPRGIQQKVPLNSNLLVQNDLIYT